MRAASCLVLTVLIYISTVKCTGIPDGVSYNFFYFQLDNMNIRTFLLVARPIRASRLKTSYNFFYFQLDNTNIAAGSAAYPGFAT